MKELNCHVFRSKDIRMMRFIEEKTLRHVDLPAPICSGFIQRQTMLLNASDISGENNNFSGRGNLNYDYYYLFTLKENGEMVPQTMWDGKETGCGVGFDKYHRLVFIDLETNKTEKVFDLVWNTEKQPTE